MVNDIINIIKVINENSNNVNDIFEKIQVSSTMISSAIEEIALDYAFALKISGKINS